MFDEMYGVYLEELDQDAALYMNALKSLQSSQEELRKAVDLANTLNNKYGDKYGYNASTVARNYSKEEIAQIKAELLDNSLLTLIKRFLGFGKKTDVIYAELMNKLSGLISYLKEEKQNRSDKLSKCTKTLQNVSERISANIDIVNEFVETEDGKFLKIGEVNDHILADAPALNVIKNTLADYMNGNEITLPYTRETNETFHFVVVYKDENGHTKANEFTRALLYQLIRKTDNYEREFHFIDAANTGSDFGELISLQKIRENNVWELNSAVTDGVYRFANIYFQNDEVRKGLKTLESFISLTANETSGYESVADYNASAAAKEKGSIPYQILVIQNFPRGFQSDEDYELLAKLINNGKQRGISVIVQCDLSDFKVFEKEVRSRVNRGGENCGDLIDTIIIENNNTQLVANDYSSDIKLIEKTFGEREWIDEFIARKTKIKVIDNKFSSIYGDNYLIGTDTCIDGMEIPFAIDRRGNIKNLILGNSTQIHGLVSGRTGVGKSALLHCLMLAASIKYSPEELEIWLADYKVQDFNVYKLNAPPNMKFLGLSNAEDFTFAFLDKLWDEYQRRTSLIVRANDRFQKEGENIVVNNYVSYRKYEGKLPRLMIVIDEFHVMSQQVADNEVYRKKLENLLSEGRSAGITIILSDQTVTTGLKGLTEKGRKQINSRLALANDNDELKEMLRTSDREELKPFENMKPGDCVLVTDEEYRDKDGALGMKKVMEQVKVIYYSSTDIPKICRRIKEYYEMPAYAPEYVDQKEESVFDENSILNQEKKKRIDTVIKTPVYLGKSLNLTGIFFLELMRKRQENIICVGGEGADQIKLIVSAIRSFQRIEGHRIYIMCDTYSELLSQYRLELERLSGDEATEVVDQPEDICEVINYLLADMKDRRKVWNTLIIWIGLDELYNDFENYSMSKPEKYKCISDGTSRKKEKEKDIATKDILSDTENKWNDLFGEEFSVLAENPEESNVADEPEEDIYNATEDIVRLLRDGSRLGIFNFVLYDTTFPLKELREFKPEYFKHKLAFDLGKEDCLTYLGRSNLLSSLKEGMAAYYDGKSVTKFKPFVLEKEENS